MEARGGNLSIPTCDLGGRALEWARLTAAELQTRADLHLKRRDRCDAASVLLELHRRGVAPDSRPALLMSLFESLQGGEYLNEYTALLLGLRQELDLVQPSQLEKLREDHARLYARFLGSRGRNPPSQFTYQGATLSLMDEAELNFSLFIESYPANPLNRELTRLIGRIHDHRIHGRLDMLDFYERRGGLPSHSLTYEFHELARILARSRDGSLVAKGLDRLLRLVVQSDLPPGQKSELSELIRTRRLEDLFARLKPLRSFEPSVSEVGGQTSWDGFLSQKGNERTVFLPIKRDFELSASKTLAGLGVVGILIAFDEPIMDFIQRNRDAGILDKLAEAGNHFGELSGLGPLIVGSFGMGLVFKNDEARNAAVSSLGSVLLGQIVIEVLKSATHRSRPDAGMGAFDFGGFGLGSDNTSFASGHSAAAWSVASVFAEEFGDEYRWAPAAAYTLAAITSFARTQKQRHWASDVVMGAMVGYVSGKVFHHFFKEVFRHRLDHIRISPLLAYSSGVTWGAQVVVSERIYADLKTWPIEACYLSHLALARKVGLDPSRVDALYRKIISGGS